MNPHAWTVRRVALPAQSRATHFYATTNLADAYSIALPDDAIDDPEQLARFVFAQQPAWIAGLLRVRDALVAGFGLKTAAQLQKVSAAEPKARVSIFRVYERHPHEVLLGEDDKHLDFRLSVLQQAGAASAREGRQLVVSTVVHCHNLLGRTYIALIAPFHRIVVRASLRQAARAGWPLRRAG